MRHVDQHGRVHVSVGLYSQTDFSGNSMRRVHQTHQSRT